jgi:hypothetical protein
VASLGLPIAWIALLALAKDPAAAAGEPIPFRVEFEAPAGCSDVEVFYAGVLSRSDRARRAGPNEAGLRLGVRLARAGNKVYGELRVLDGRGEGDTRKMEGVRCDEVVEVLSLTAALAIDPAARLSPARPAARAAAPNTPFAAPPAPSPPVAAAAPSPPAETPPPPPPETPPVTEPAASAAIEAQPREPSSVGVVLGVTTLGATVVSQSFNFGGALSVGLAGVRDAGAGPSVSLSGLYLSNDLVQSATDVAITVAGAALTGCPGFSLGSSVVLEPCARAMGGWLSATGRGVTDPMSKSRSWWTVGALGRLAVAFGGGFALEIEAGFAVPLVRREFFTETPERTVGATPTISAMAGIGLSRRL